MQRATETLDHFPSIAQVDQIAAEMGIRPEPLKVVPIRALCPDCDGLGYFIVENVNGNSACASCEMCERGRALAKREVHPLAPLSEARKHGYELPIRRGANG